MKLSCPRCQRVYQLPESLQGRFLRCACTALLTLPDRTADSAEQIAIPEVQNQFEAPEGWYFPDFLHLIDLNQYAVEEPELPDVDDELPSLDELPEFDEEAVEDAEPEMSSEQEEALGGISVEDESSNLDSRLKPLLEEFKASEDPQFLVDVLYLLLEVKDPQIRDVVEPHRENSNPVASYLARRILADLDYVESEEHKKKPLYPYPRDTILKTVFTGGEDARVQLLNKVSNENGFGATPYFMLQLLTEKEASGKSRILPKLGLIASACEANWFGRFLDEPGPRVRLAAVEGLACIGGDAAMPSLIKGMVDKDMQVVSAIKTAIKDADTLELAQHIYQYLLHHPHVEKKSYISILTDLKNTNAFRALVWMFEEQPIRNFALETARTFELADELKADIVLEYLTLSYVDDSFHTTVLEFMETLDPTFSPSRIEPVNQFDDSYVQLIRDSPLFTRDFASEASAKDQDLLAQEVQLQPYSILHHFQKRAAKLKSSLQLFPLYLKTPRVLGAFCMQSLLFTLCSLVIFSGLFKGMGAASPTVSFDFLPSQFDTTTGSLIFSNSEFMGMLTSWCATVGIAALMALPIGLMLAFQQIRNQQYRLRFLPMIPVFISPVLLGHWMEYINVYTQHKTPGLILAGTSCLCLISIAYLVYLRFLSLAPLEWSRSLQSLGASADQALFESSRGLLIPATVVYLCLASSFLVSSLAFGYTFPADSTPGAFLLTRMEYAEGWLMIGLLGSLSLLIPGIGFAFVFALFPAACLIPHKNFNNQDWKREIENGLLILGLLFRPLLGPTYIAQKAKPQKKKSGKEKKNAEPAPQAESDDTPTEPAKK